MRILTWIAASILTAFGFVGAIGYAIAAIMTADRDQLVTDYGALAAFSAAGCIAGMLAITGLLRRLPRTVRLPNEWLSLILFGVAIAAGFGIVQADRYLVLTPLIAICAATCLFLFIGRIAVRWVPGGRIESPGFILPGIWGMIGAPLTAMFVQIGAGILLLGGGVAGLYFADASLMDSLDQWIEEAAELTDLSIIQTPTVAAGALAMLGIVAPLSEELAKFLGVYIVFRRRVTSRLMLFVAGAASGLGFAVVETLGYALMAIDQWPQVMLIRAPVAFVHVAASTIVAIGWYKQRQSGGYWLAGFFILSVLLHAAWNSLFVSMLIVAGDVTSTDSMTTATVGTTLVVVSAMGAVLVAAVLWIIANARRFGSDLTPELSGPGSEASTPSIRGMPV